MVRKVKYSPEQKVQACIDFVSDSNGIAIISALKDGLRALNGETGTSQIFRVEALDECCCKCRVLAPNPDTTTVATYPYVATNDFFTINLNCLCAIKCLGDVHVTGL